MEPLPILRGERVLLRPLRDEDAAQLRLGFGPVGVLRRSERHDDGEWHDGLLMDLLADELLG